MKGSLPLLQIVLHIHMYVLCMYVCAYACVGLCAVYINQQRYHLLLKIFTKVCSLKSEYQKDSSFCCEIPRIKQLQEEFDQPTQDSAHLNMQLLISTGYTKLLVTTQVLFLKYVVEESMCVSALWRGCEILSPSTPVKFTVSSLRCAWKQLPELMVGGTK